MVFVNAAPLPLDSEAGLAHTVRMGATATVIGLHQGHDRCGVIGQTDDDLAAGVRAGVPAAFEEIYDRYARGILAFCAHMLGNRDAAEDALQLTLVSAYRALRGGENPIVLRPWLYTIARNRCLSELRARRDAIRVEVLHHEADTGTGTTDGSTPPPPVATSDPTASWPPASSTPPSTLSGSDTTSGSTPSAPATPAPAPATTSASSGTTTAAPDPTAATTGTGSTDSSGSATAFAARTSTADTAPPVTAAAVITATDPTQAASLTDGTAETASGADTSASTVTSS